MFAFFLGPWEMIIIGLVVVVPLIIIAAVVATERARKAPPKELMLSPCPDCGRFVSPKATTCPQCGRPL